MGLIGDLFGGKSALKKVVVCDRIWMFQQAKVIGV